MRKAVDGGGRRGGVRSEGKGGKGRVFPSAEMVDLW
jgi:hypothetical protein